MAGCILFCSVVKKGVTGVSSFNSTSYNLLEPTNLIVSSVLLSLKNSMPQPFVLTVTLYFIT
jgi:hypothetical protein